MAANTKIAWATHTFNPWIGCTKVSPGCANCYAEAEDKRRQWTAEGFGPGKPRKITSWANWQQPLKWNNEAKNSGTRPRVFCASLADWLDDEVPVAWLADLLDLIGKTPHLDWLLLTKRPEKFNKRIDAVIDYNGKNWKSLWTQGEVPKNVWLGTTVENQEMANKRIPDLLKIPARVRFLSCEPLLGPVDLADLVVNDGKPGERHVDCLDNEGLHIDDDPDFKGATIDWVIAGGESGSRARPMHPAWLRGLRDQCKVAGVPFFFKQWGEWIDGNSVADLPDHEPKRIGHLALDGTLANDVTMPFNKRDGMKIVVLVGRKITGRLLDGVEHNEIPEVQP